MMGAKAPNVSTAALVFKEVFPLNFLKKFLIYLLCGALLAGSGFFIGTRLGGSPDASKKLTVQSPTTVPTEAPETTAAPETTEEETEAAAERSSGAYSLSFVGSLTLGNDGFMATTSSSFAAVVGDDYGYPLKNVAELLSQDDLTIGNLECALTDQDYSTKGGARLYKGEPGYANILSLGGVDVVSLANDHSLDYGETGLAATVEALDASAVKSVQKDTALVVDADGLKVGIYAITSQASSDDIAAAVQQLRDQGAQLIVAATHWGGEDTYVVNPDQKKLGRKLIDAGVNIVCGTGPQHVQKIENYHGGIIYYSLGSLVSGVSDYPSDMDSVIIQQEVLLDETGAVTLGEHVSIPVCMSSATPQNIYQAAIYPTDSTAYSRVAKKLFDDYTFGRNAQEYPF